MFLEVTIGLINVFMGMDIFELFPKTYVASEDLGKAVLTTASGMLVLGAVWAKKQHRAHILLIWLAAVVIYIGTHVYNIRRCYLQTWIYDILLVGMGALIYRVYTKELEDTKDKDSHEYETKKVEEKPQAPSAPEASHPPSYEAMVPQVKVY